MQGPCLGRSLLPRNVNHAEIESPWVVPVLLNTWLGGSTSGSATAVTHERVQHPRTSLDTMTCAGVHRSGHAIREHKTFAVPGVQSDGWII